MRGMKMYTGIVPTRDGAEMIEEFDFDDTTFQIYYFRKTARYPWYHFKLIAVAGQSVQKGNYLLSWNRELDSFSGGKETDSLRENYDGLSILLGVKLHEFVQS